jgi:hypothetical protein
MTVRRIGSRVVDLLAQFPAVAVLGPHQVGKTTLALALAENMDSVYLDLKLPSDLAKIAEPELYLVGHEDRLVIIDEIQRAPGLFQVLRGLIDVGRRKGRRTGRFLILGSASIYLLKQSSETLAGRIAYVELSPFDILETNESAMNRLWLRGGFPDSFLADSDEASLAWRRNFILTYLERYIPQLGPRIPAETLRRFWSMIANEQGSLLNMARIGSGLGITGQTVGRYLDLMVDLLLVRRLQPWHGNASKRLFKSPRVFVRDSGIVHALLGLPTGEDLLGHPVVGPGWEGFVVENLIACAPDGTEASFYRATGGAEIDLVVRPPGSGPWAIEIKRSLDPRPNRGFHQACEDIVPDHAFVVYPGTETYPTSETVTAIPLRELAAKLNAS